MFKKTRNLKTLFHFHYYFLFFKQKIYFALQVYFGLNCRKLSIFSLDIESHYYSSDIYIYIYILVVLEVTFHHLDSALDTELITSDTASSLSTPP